jgi:ribosomal-protein-alanine N-acetyltransferase
MESANRIDASGVMRPAAGAADGWLQHGLTDGVVRAALPEDGADLTRLLRIARFHHQHADWQPPGHWLGQPGALLWQRNGQADAFLAATCDPPPVAWLRTFAIARGAPHAVLATLLEAALPHLMPAGATHLACITPERWLQEALRGNGFAQSAEIEVWIKRDMEIPPLSPSAVTVRPVESTDYPLLAALEQRAFADPLWWHSADQLRQATPHARSFTVAVLDGQPVGFQYSQGTEGHALQSGGHLVRITVDPAWQGHGIASTLLADAIETLRRAGIRQMTLNTQADNPAAHRLYARFGFRPTSARFAVWSRPLAAR